MIALKISRVGNSAALILTKEALALLHAELGDTVYLTETPEGLRITPYNAEFERDMKLARRVMRKRKNVLRELAK
ncbi:MAG TPA: transcriptional regulator [Stellaceae bacterium]|nr:transcriptional regulator [Stellaceae bacterium]